MNTDTLALVESPAQLLHVLEWCHAEQSADRTRLVVLKPTDPTTVTQLQSMADFAAEEGIETEWFAPQGIGAGRRADRCGPAHRRPRRASTGDRATRSPA